MEKIEENTNFRTSDFLKNFLSYKTRKIPNKDSVYIDFKSFYNENIKDKKDFLGELLKFSRYYSTITIPENFQKAKNSKEIVSLLKEIITLKVEVYHPDLLEVFDDFSKQAINEEDLREILQIIVNYVFRRQLCEVPTNALNKVFLSLIADVKKEKNFSYDYVNIFKGVLIRKSSSSRFPEDEKVRNALLERNIYAMKNKNYFFQKLENYQNKEGVDEGKFQIEHIVPKTLLR